MSPVGQSGSRAAGQESRGTSSPDRPTVSLICNRCGFPVSSRAMGCKNPCANCGTVYPLGDCSD
jgi:hypothetical protein